METAAAILYHILKYNPAPDKIVVQAEIQVFWDVTLLQLVNTDRQSRASYFLHIQAQAIQGKCTFLGLLYVKADGTTILTSTSANVSIATV